MGSIMHYGLTALSANTKNTIIPLRDIGKHYTYSEGKTNEDAFSKPIFLQQLRRYLMLSFSGGQRVGQMKGLSTTDVDKLHTVYQCYGEQYDEDQHMKINKTSWVC